jgi:hypothetical protein
MEKIERYRKIIYSVLTPLLSHRYSGLDVQNEAAFDEKNDRYLIMSVGWQQKKRRIHGCLIHLDIVDGKIYIQRDGTEDGIAYELEAAGVPKSDIVLSFHPEDVRPHTGYAVA